MRRLPIAVVALVVGLALAGPGQVAGEEKDKSAPSTLTFRGASPARTQGHLTLAASLATAEGKPLSNRSIEFFQGVSLFGAREAYLGAAITDATGTAVIAFQPAQAGRHEITARFLGDDGYARAESSGAIEVREVAPPFRSRPLPFAGFAEWLPYALGALILAIWVVLASVFLRTAQGVRAAARASQAPSAVRASRTGAELASEAQE